ncbi:class-II fumarase/aspartase family protein [Aquincola tertiaricarbonis]|uniref:class-II fumarase/aspartase family protein n=1 Tax=Aquincola tertiaricarbonis TaxID=391953 RepID=UPI001E473914|nr:adenylosuccinate lyase family protein [Aquincola tertiaricarbonis]
MFESFVTRHWFNEAAKAVWSDAATLQAWLDVEATLAQAQAELGVIPTHAANVIRAQAQAGRFDLDALAAEIAFAQHPLVPVLHRFEALCGEPAAGYIHWGATTQNIFDTASALQMQQTHRLLLQHLGAAIEAIAALAVEHADTPMAGRTHGQHALPMTFGLKAAGWLDELDRHRVRLNSRIAASFPACMGGAIGSFAATGEVGRRVETLLAGKLGLQPAGLSMRSSYDRAADYVCGLGLLAGTAQKIAQDVVFLQRTEIGEAAESFHMGKVGSSTMAQKRNPSTALLLVSLARLLRARVPPAIEAMVRMDEGDSSSTNVTDTMLPEIAVIATSIAETLATLTRGLQVDAVAMRRNLRLTRGLISSEAAMMRLTSAMGRHEAHRILYNAAQQAVSQDVDFEDALRQDAALADLPASADLEGVLDPQAYVGQSATLARETAKRVGAQR